MVVKVSREVAEALNEIRGRHETSINDFMKRHAEGKSSSMFSVLDKFRTVYIGHLIYSGDYEIEETPEEKLLNEFNNAIQIADIKMPGSYEQGYWTGFKDGIYETLEIKKEKIKGINE